MPDNIMDRFTDAVSRRSFLGTLSAAAAALVLSLFGKARAEGLVQVRCCRLCLNPNSCSFSSCSCVWGWTCPNPDGTCSRCRECYTARPTCLDNGCLGIKCSQVLSFSCTGPTSEGGKEDPNPPPPPG
jgi:hypothetical protein